MVVFFDRFKIALTRSQAVSAFHPGNCDDDVRALLSVPAIVRQFGKINPDDIRLELKEYGAWNDNELRDNQANMERIVWIAAGNIVEKSP